MSAVRKPYLSAISAVIDHSEIITGVSGWMILMQGRGVDPNFDKNPMDASNF